MADDCCTTDGNIMILACSGGSKVGQLTNQAAVELAREDGSRVSDNEPDSAKNCCS